jgi:hypothetical protein
MSEGAARRYLRAAWIIDDLPAADAPGIIICVERGMRAAIKGFAADEVVFLGALLSSFAPTNSLPDH